MVRIINVFCDGGARGNPGPAAIGVVIKHENGKVLHQFGKKIGETTNNVAEYTAVIEGLSLVQQKFNQTKPLTLNFYLDSELIVKQLNGVYKIKHPKLRELLMRVRELEGDLDGEISYRHVLREKNKQADKLVNGALDNTF